MKPIEVFPWFSNKPLCGFTVVYLLWVPQDSAPPAPSNSVPWLPAAGTPWLRFPIFSGPLSHGCWRYLLTIESWLVCCFRCILILYLQYMAVRPAIPNSCSLAPSTWILVVDIDKWHPHLPAIEAPVFKYMGCFTADMPLAAAGPVEFYDSSCMRTGGEAKVMIFQTNPVCSRKKPFPFVKYVST